MITALLVDDEPKNITTLAHFLQAYCPDVNIMATANDIQTARQQIDLYKPQLVFLDVEMPYGSGFDLLQSLPSIEFEVVFVTGFNQYALNAFRFAALDYLLKPVDIEQLIATVKRAAIRIAEKNSAAQYETLLANIATQNTAAQKITFTDKNERYFIPLSDIMYCVAEGSYTHVHTINKTFLSSHNLKEFENMLPGSMFIRVHHGHLVNTAFIQKFQSGRGGLVVMQDGRELEVAVRRKDEFFKHLNALKTNSK